MIELFKQPNIDWMGKAKYFYGLSGILLLAGTISVARQGGLRYGLDFKGGTNVDVRFAQPPNIDQLRNGLTAQGIVNKEIQGISDFANPGANEVIISLEQKGEGDQALDESKTRIISALNAIYGSTNSGKSDFNAATPSSLAAALTQRDPLGLSVNAGDRYKLLAKKILDYRDKDKNGILTNFDDLSKVDGVTAPVASFL
jgi:preprotein translocase subunit SecF